MYLKIRSLSIWSKCTLTHSTYKNTLSPFSNNNRPDVPYTKALHTELVIKHSIKNWAGMIISQKYKFDFDAINYVYTKYWPKNGRFWS